MRFFPPTLIFLSLLQLGATAEIPPISLTGEWRFQLAPEKIGVNALWPHRALSDTILLPGTTDENKKGIFTDYRPMDRLARVWNWKGEAWYQRDITIPSSWKGKRITLFLERTKHSHLWVNGKFVAWNDSLGAPHVFVITDAVLYDTKIPLTLLIDNSKLPPVGPSHALDERTQTNWNGILSRIELRATDPVWIDASRCFPTPPNAKHVSSPPPATSLAKPSSETIIRTLINIASKGGNYLLNIGPKADGSIPQPSIDIMTATGKWMDTNAEAIRGTTRSPIGIPAIRRSFRTSGPLPSP